MSEPIDIVAHTASAGFGATLTLIVDRVIRYFSEKSRRTEELELAARLARMQSTLDQIAESFKSYGGFAERLAKLEGIEEGRSGRRG